MGDDATRDWAFLLFSALAPTAPTHLPPALVEVLRGQMGVDEGRAGDMVRLTSRHGEGECNRRTTQMGWN